MSDEGFPRRIREAVERIGGQAETVRQIARRYGKRITQQAIAHLARTGPGVKSAKGSAPTPLIAALAGMQADWLATGRGPKWLAEVGSPPEPPLAQSLHPESGFQALEPAQEVAVVEITRSTAELIRAWEALPENERMRYKREIVARAALYRDPIPDERLGHLAAPPVEPAAPAPAKRRRGTPDEGSH